PGRGTVHNSPFTRRLPLPPCGRARLRTGRHRTRERDLRSRSRPRSTRSGVTGESPRARSRRSSNISEGVPWRLSLLAVGCARPDADRAADGEHVDGGKGDARGRAEEPVPEYARPPCFSAGGARSLRATERPPQGDLQRGTRKMRCFAHVRLPSPTSTHNLPELERRSKKSRSGSRISIRTGPLLRRGSRPSPPRSPVHLGRSRRSLEPAGRTRTHSRAPRPRPCPRLESPPSSP